MTNLWEFLAGLGIFLFAMQLLEDALKHLAGRTFKLFLRKHTGNKLSAIGSGAIVTGVLQSSSVVILMALAFVGAGAITMRNALAVVVGSNFGTTLDSWVVATIGFKFSIESFALPIVAVAGISMAFLSGRKRLFYYASFLFAFGLLFLGLDFMKESIELFVKEFDITGYLGYPRIVFVLIGFVITALIQSSSATMVIVLSALHTGVIPLETAASVIIGAELGTAIKIVLGSIGGIAAKKRVALGNIIFNLLVTAFAFLMLDVLLYLIAHVFGVKDGLISLVLFQSLINLAGVLVFYPFMDRFVQFLEKRYSKEVVSSTEFIDDVTTTVSEAAVEALEKEVLLFITRVAELNLEAFHVDERVFISTQSIGTELTRKYSRLKSYEERYADIKYAEGLILTFYFKLREEEMNGEEIKRVDQLVASVRNAMYAAKCIKDIRHNRKDFRDSADDLKYAYYKYDQLQLIQFYSQLNELFRMEELGRAGGMCKLNRINQDNYDSRMQRIYRDGGKDSLVESDISTLLNVNRELYSSGKAVIMASANYLLTSDQLATLQDQLSGDMPR